MKAYKPSPWAVILCLLIFIVFLYMISTCKFKCNMPQDKEGYWGQRRYWGGGYYNAAEFQPACLWDNARAIRLSNGGEGVCTAHGLAIPNPGTNNSQARFMGMSTDMIGSIMGAELRRNHQDSESYSGQTAIDMLL